MTETTIEIPTKKLFRIESIVDKRSLWYKANGEFDPFIMTLTDGKSRDLPMGFSDVYGFNNFRWFSACDNVELMRTWFSDQDAYELNLNNFVLSEYVVAQWRDLPMETVFTREGVVSQKEISISTIWDISNFESKVRNV